jgi:hypothetical protein
MGFRRAPACERRGTEEATPGLAVDVAPARTIRARSRARIRAVCRGRACRRDRGAAPGAPGSRVLHASAGAVVDLGRGCDARFLGGLPCRTALDLGAASPASARLYKDVASCDILFPGFSRGCRLRPLAQFKPLVAGIARACVPSGSGSRARVASAWRAPARPARRRSRSRAGPRRAARRGRRLTHVLTTADCFSASARPRRAHSHDSIRSSLGGVGARAVGVEEPRAGASGSRFGAPARRAVRRGLPSPGARRRTLCLSARARLRRPRRARRAHSRTSTAWSRGRACRRSRGARASASGSRVLRWPPGLESRAGQTKKVIATQPHLLIFTVTVNYL